MRNLYIILLSTILLHLPFVNDAQICLTTESRTNGEVYGPFNGQSAGDSIYTEAGIPVSIEDFMLIDSTIVFNSIEVQPWESAGITGLATYMSLSNIKYDFTNTGGQITHVTLDFWDGGGDKNLSINGNRLVMSSFTETPFMLGGVLVEIDTTFNGVAIDGTMTLTGPVNDLALGAGELFVDNVCYAGDTLGCPMAITNIGIMCDENIGDYAEITIDHAPNGTFFEFILGDSTTGTIITDTVAYAPSSTETIFFVGPMDNSSFSWPIQITDLDDETCQVNSFIGNQFCYTCEITNFNVVPLACQTDGYFDVEFSFDSANSSGVFDLTVNSNPISYTYNPSTDTYLAGPFYGLPTFPYLFQIRDSVQQNCFAQQLIENVDCNPPPCDISFANNTIMDCDSLGFYNIELEFTYENPATNYMIEMAVPGNPQLLGPFPYDTPDTIRHIVGPFDSNVNGIQILVYDANDFLCSEIFDVGTVTCNTVPSCEITGLTVSPQPCTPNEIYYVDFNFQHANTSSSTFDLYANGSFVTSYSYQDSTNYIAGPFNGDGTDYNFEVIDGSDSACSDSYLLSGINCVVDSCALTNLWLDWNPCQSDGTRIVQFGFNAANPTGTHFILAINNLIVDTMAYQNISEYLTQPLVLQGNDFIEIIDIDNPDCRINGTITAQPCVCDVQATSFSVFGCDSAGYFNIDIALEHNNFGGSFIVYTNNIAVDTIPRTGTTTFYQDTQLGNGVSTFEYLFVSLEDSSCMSSPFEILAEDCFPNTDTCLITSLNVVPGACLSDGTYYVNLSVQSSVDPQFELDVNGVLSSYTALGNNEYLAGPYTGDGSNMIFSVSEPNIPTCIFVDTILAPNCNTNNCSLSNLVVENLPCSPSGEYDIEFNFDFENVGARFDVSVDNGAIYNFAYDSTGYTLFNLSSNSAHTLLIVDQADPNCSISYSIPAIPCGPCTIDSVRVVDLNCDAAGNFTALLEVTTGFNGGHYSIYVNNEYVGVNSYFQNFRDTFQIGPYPGDGMTSYSVTVQDTTFSDCMATTIVGPVDCQPDPVQCLFNNFQLQTLPCNASGEFGIDFNFDVEGVGSSFALYLDNNFVQSFPYNGNGYTLDGLEANISHSLVLIDQADSSCMLMNTIPVVQCDLCGIDSLSITDILCDSTGNFVANLEVQTGNSNGTFAVYVNNSYSGAYDYTASSTQSFSVGPLAGDNVTSYTIVVQDTTDFNCGASTVISSVNCFVQPDECVIGEIGVDLSECDSTGFIYAELSFDHAFTSSTFSVLVNGDTLTSAVYDNNNVTFITVGPFLADDSTEYEIVIYDDAHPDCSQLVVIDPIDCGNVQMPCEIWNLFVEANDCDSTGMFYVDFGFDRLNASQNGFNLLVNNQLYDSYNYNDSLNFYTAGPFIGDGMTTHIFRVEDSTIGNCSAEFELSPVTCIEPNECSILSANVNPLDCNEDGTYSVMLDVEIDSLIGQSFIVYNNQFLIDTFQVANLPLEIPNFIWGGNTMDIITICEADNPECCFTVEFEALICDTDCHILDVVATPQECGDGTFMVELDLVAINTSIIGFQVLGNGTNYGLFNYSDLPVMIGPLVGDGLTTYEFVVIDQAILSCANFTTIDPIECPSCAIQNVTAIPDDCQEDGTFMVNLNFDYANVTGTGFRVTGNGDDYGTFTYDSTGVVVGPIQGDATDWEFIITDLDNPDCTSFVELGVNECEVTSTENALAENIKIFTDESTDNLIIRLQEINDKDILVNVYNAVGQKVITTVNANNSEIRLNINHLISGIYVAEVRLKSGAVVQKIFKN